jgi:hypothetical protein
MNYLKLTCVFLFAIQISTTFSQSNADYYPWKTGDMWEYTLYYWPEIDTLQTIVINDSTDEEDNIYATYFTRAINPIEPPSPLLTDTLVYKIDPSLYVYHRYFDFNYFGEWINAYRLNGNAGDQWVMWDYSHTGAGPFEMAKIDSIKESVLFEQNTNIMYMSYFWAFFDGTDTIKLFRYYDQLAKGFGLYFRVASELDALLFLQGCVIDGFLYGDTTKIITSINDQQNDYSSAYDFTLFQNYPNPFNPTTTISYLLPKNGLVALKVFDILGIEVASLVNETQEAGSYSVIFNASQLPSGIYFYTLTSVNFMATKKLILLK